MRACTIRTRLASVLAVGRLEFRSDRLVAPARRARSAREGRAVMGLVTLGESMARLSSTVIGSLRHTPTLALGVAGAEGNVAVAATRLGLPATWIGRVGDDEFGRLIVATLRGEGVCVRASVDADAPTGLLIKEYRTRDATRVTYYRSGSAGSRLNPDDLDPEAIAEAEVLHVTGITLALSESAALTVHTAVAMAKEAGVPVSLDLNFRGSLWSAHDAATAYRRLLPSVDVLFAGDDEAKILVDNGDRAHVAHSLANLGPRVVVIKSGADGALSLSEGRSCSAPAHPVHPVDPVGAGDAFCAAYLVAWTAGASPSDRLDQACRAGAIVVASEGDWERHTPTR